MKSIIVTTLGAAGLMLAALPAAAQPAASSSVAAAQRCADLARFTLPGSDLQISAIM